MGVIATFDFGWWTARYPEFVASGTYPGVNEVQANAFFQEAGLYWRNDGSGPVNDTAMQSMLMNMVTAHIAMLAVGTSNQPASGLVGRISSAGQGSVNVSVDLPAVPGTLAWWAQTQYGISFSQATAAYRTFQYRPGPSRYFGTGLR